MRDIIAALVRRAGKLPDSLAFADPMGRLSWRQLARRVAGSAGSMRELPPTIGLLAENSLDWTVSDLASAAAGRTLVPLPTMFSDGQLVHIVKEAGIGCIIADAVNAGRAGRLHDRVVPVSTHEGDAMPDGAARARRIIYTSGSTGAPKGVRLGDRQLGAMASALASAIAADSGDRYLSVLPFSLLLEELCAIHVPVLVGARCDIEPDMAAAVAGGNAGAVAAAAERHRPTVMVLVPEMLRAWIAAIRHAGRRAPETLRFVAVGGAPVPASLADAAWDLGIPVHEGYGLSECCSVVTLNRPGARTAGTVGTPLDGTAVTIDDGEIVVSGPQVMDGYLGGPAVDGVWRTGDLGRVDDDGRLIVDGRRDNLLVTALGRNVQAEWIETMLAGDPRIARAIVVGHGAPHLTAIVVPAAGSQALFDDPRAARSIVEAACRTAPDYAVPRTIIAAGMDALAAAGLLTPAGRPRRKAICGYFAASAPTTTPRKDPFAA